MKLSIPMIAALLISSLTIGASISHANEIPDTGRNVHIVDAFNWALIQSQFGFHKEGILAFGKCRDDYAYALLGELKGGSDDGFVNCKTDDDMEILIPLPTLY